VVVADDPRSASRCDELADGLTRDRKLATDRAEVRAVVVRATQAMSECPDSVRIRGAAAWAIWDAEISRAPAGEPLDALAAAVERIRVLQAPNPYGDKSAYVRALNDVLTRAARSRDRGGPAVVAGLVSAVDSSKLGTAPSEFGGRTVESQARRYFDSSTGVLAGSSDHAPLAERICSEALASGAYRDARERRWVTYRLAKLVSARDPARAIQLLDGLRGAGALETAMVQLLVRLHVEAGTGAAVAEDAVRAVLNIEPTGLKFSVRLLLDTAELLPDGDGRAMARPKLVQLARVVQARERRRPDARGEAMASELGLPAPTGREGDRDVARLLNEARADLR